MLMASRVWVRGYSRLVRHIKRDLCIDISLFALTIFFVIICIRQSVRHWMLLMLIHQ